MSKRFESRDVLADSYYRNCFTSNAFTLQITVTGQNSIFCFFPGSSLIDRSEEIEIYEQFNLPVSLSENLLQSSKFSRQIGRLLGRT